MPSLTVKIVKYTNSQYKSPPSLVLEGNIEGDLVGLIDYTRSGNFLSILAGISEMERGEIQVNQTTWSEAVRRQKINLLPPMNDYFFSQTPKDFMLAMGRLRGLSSGKAKAQMVGLKAAYQLESIIKDYKKKLILDLEPEDKKVIELVSLLMGSPEVILLEHWFDDLLIPSEKIKTLLDKIKKKVMVLFTIQDESLAECYADNIYHITSGVIKPLKSASAGRWIEQKNSKKAKVWSLQINSKNVKAVVDELLQSDFARKNKVEIIIYDRNHMVISASKKFSIIPVFNLLIEQGLDVMEFFVVKN